MILADLRIVSLAAMALEPPMDTLDTIHRMNRQGRNVVPPTRNRFRLSDVTGQ